MAGSESAIWEVCKSSASSGPISGTLTRIVESQEQVATTILVGGDLAKQDILERLIETSKLPRRSGTERLDYLLATPWRYPPLRYGSRFGSVNEPSLFYGALGIETALAETAYYRCVLREDMTTPPARIVSLHTSFEARFRTEAGMRLFESPFDAHLPALTHPSDYRACQALGTELRRAGVQGFEFSSARDPAGGANIALVEPRVLVSRRHQRPVQWSCALSANDISFRSRTQPSTLRTFDRSVFEVNGVLPRPA